MAAAVINGQTDETDCWIKGKVDRLVPNISFEQATSLIRRVYGYEDVVCLREFDSYENQNLLMEVRDRADRSGGAAEKYILKLTNNLDSLVYDYYLEQSGILRHVSDKGIACQRPVMNLQGDDISRESLTFKKQSGEEVSGFFMLRLMEYLPGVTMGTAERLTADMCFKAGQFLGKLTRVLQDYQGVKSVFVKRAETLRWSLSNLPALRRYLHLVKDVTNKRMVEEIMTAFESRVLGNAQKLRRGFIYGDFNEANVLVRQIKTPAAEGQGARGTTEHYLFGILDFDDMTYSCIVYEVAIAIMYMMQCCNLEQSPLDSGGIFLAGYLTEWPLNAAEMEALYYCIAGRFAQSLVLGLHAHYLNPHNDFVISSQVKGWNVTRELWGLGVSALYSQWEDLSKKYNDHFKEQ